MASPYLEKPKRSLPEAVEEIARSRGVSPEHVYRLLSNPQARPSNPVEKVIPMHPPQARRSTR